MAESKAAPAVEDEGYEAQMTILGHLNDLRVRLTWAAAGIFMATLISFIFAEPALRFLLSPYEASSAGGAELQTLRPTEGIETFFKVALLLGAVISMPLTLLQLWKFIQPGLTRRERRDVYIFVPTAFAFFLGGLAFAWFVLAPSAIFFLANFLPDIFRTEWTGQDYISFVLTLLFWMGISFQMPIIMFFVARLGVIGSEALKSQWRVAMVAVAVLAAIITPSIDPITMLLTMAPLLVLYLLSIVTAAWGQRQFEASVGLEAGDVATGAS